MMVSGTGSTSDTRNALLTEPQPICLKHAAPPAHTKAGFWQTRLVRCGQEGFEKFSNHNRHPCPTFSLERVEFKDEIV